MAPRGRRSGYQNYSANDAMLLCAIADKMEPIGRNMWEEVAVVYNAKRSRNSIDRDYDSLRRKFKSLYTLPKPSGSNGELPPKLKPVRYAQEIQVRIERKGGAVTSHDGLDGGEDDGSLQREMEKALGTGEDEGGREEDSEEEQGFGSDDSNGSGEMASPGEEGRREGPFNVNGNDDSQEQHRQNEEQENGGPDAVGSIVTSHGIFDVSLGDEVYSSEAKSNGDSETEAEVSHGVQAATGMEDDSQVELVGTATTPGFSPSEANAQQAQVTRNMLASETTGGSRDTTEASSTLTPSSSESSLGRVPGMRKPAAPSIRHGLRPLQTSVRTESPKSADSRQLYQKVSTPTSTGGRTPSMKSPADQAQAGIPAKKRGIGRPKSKKKPTRPTYSDPDGPILYRDPAKATKDALEAGKYDKLSFASNRLGGCDLRVLRDNMDVMNSRSDEGNSKRPPSEKSLSGGNFVMNKRQKGRAKMKDLESAMARVEEKQHAGGNEIMQLLVFMRQDTAERAAAEERRRRDESEEKLASERAAREEREQVRRDEAAAAEARQQLKIELARLEREDREKREAAAARENTRRYEERIERERADARERHEAMILMFTSLQQGLRGRSRDSDARPDQSNV